MILGKSCKIILIYYIGYIKKHNGNKYLTLVYADESKSTLEENEKLRKKVQNIEIEILEIR